MHLIFTIKSRRKLFDGCMIEQLWDFCSSGLKLECEILEMNGEAYCVHLRVTYPPGLAVRGMVNNLKSASSRIPLQQITHLRNVKQTDLLWSRAYFACNTRRETLATIKSYAQSQSTLEFLNSSGFSPGLPHRIRRRFLVYL